MDTSEFDTLAVNDMDESPASLPTPLPAPPRMPTFLPQSISLRAPRRPSLQLVAVNANPNPMQTRATVPVLRLVRIARPSMPPTPPTPPSIPPTGSTPIRRAA